MLNFLFAKQAADGSCFKLAWTGVVIYFGFELKEVFSLANKKQSEERVFSGLKEEGSQCIMTIMTPCRATPIKV